MVIVASKNVYTKEIGIDMAPALAKNVKDMSRGVGLAIDYPRMLIQRRRE